MAKKNTGRKEVIVDTAKSLFSQKGYDATSMEEIATQAGVPKSLIYYHFKSKEDLLNAIVGRFSSDYEQLLEPGDGEQIGGERYFHFLYANKDFLKIIVGESLKGGGKSIPILDVVRQPLQHESKETNNVDLLDYQKTHARWVAEFFTSIVPFVMFACYADDWCRYFETDLDAATSDFLTAYKQTHGAYHALLQGGSDECNHTS